MRKTCHAKCNNILWIKIVPGTRTFFTASVILALISGSVRITLGVDGALGDLPALPLGLLSCTLDFEREKTLRIWRGQSVTVITSVL